MDTVTGAIEWAMAESLQNPEAMKKLKEELKECSWLKDIC